MGKTVETRDIVLAATLKVMGYKLDHIERVGSRGIFFFVADEGEEKLQEVLNNYYLGKLLVEPMAFNAAIKALTTACRRPT
jgi:hypothetical protein